MQPLGGSLGTHEQSLMITTSNVSKSAVKEAAQADKTPIALMNGEQNPGLLIEHSMGMRRTPSKPFEIEKEYPAGEPSQSIWSQNTLENKEGTMPLLPKP